MGGHAQLANQFVANGERAKWHDQALWFVRQKRDNISHAIPEWETLRETASQVKLHTVTHLAQYLEEFEKNAQAMGVHVHWASNAAEHNEIVLRILQQHEVKRVVKSKSMLTEECHLNPHLEAAGIEVVDTDLGERIVQLRKEPPSHIVLPAIHIKKEEVGDVFHEHLGTDAGASDPGYLTEAARQHLRENFLAADAGITGVNFGIASTGGFVVCTNEGNADLGTALPNLHIACMGIEKLIPAPEYLSLFTRLLARSATGQPITTYTSHFHGPKPGGEMHIVLVDNGRSDILGSDEFRRSLSCIRCGACMNTCPVYRRSGGHSYQATVPGPIGSILGPAHNAAAHSTLPYACSLCGSCTDVCPVKIDLHHQLLTWRKEIRVRGLLPFTKTFPMKVMAQVFQRPGLYAFGGKVARIALRLMPRWMIYNPLNGWGRQRDLPTAPRESFRDLYKKRKK
ncbi:MAG: lactate utilization protein [Planctomycetaceae bacterium]|nr:lactate utilization protein [Planctomycetaceae bacterium]